MRCYRARSSGWVTSDQCNSRACVHWFAGHDAVCVISKYRRFTMDTDVSAMPLIGPDSSVIVACDDGVVICVEVASGAAVPLA